MNLFIRALIDNIDRRFNLLLEELIHLSYIIRFFYPSISESTKGYRSCVPTAMFKELWSFTKELGEELINSVNDWEDVKKKIGEFPQKKEAIQSLSREDASEWSKIFERFIALQNKVNESLLSKFDFIHKKLLSYQSGSQHYYPNPRITCIKEATKIHLYMENIANGLLSLLTETNGRKRDVLFFWDYSPEIRFLGKENKFLVINTDFFLPYRQSHWIILLHEVLHYLLVQSEKGEPPTKSKFFEELIRYINSTTNDCRIAVLKTGIDVIPDRNVIVDIFIDSLLTQIYGLRYLLPASVCLFAYDEKSFCFPHIRRWFVRLSTLIKLSSLHLPSMREKEKKFVLDLVTFLDFYHKLQVASTNSTIEEDFFVMESVIENTVTEKVKEFLKKFSSKNLIRNLKNLKNFCLLRELRTPKDPWLRAYLLYSKIYVEGYLKEIYKKEEGRPVCFIFQEICCKKENFKEKEFEEKIRKGFNFKVFKFNLFKLRFNAGQTSFGDWKEIPWSFGLSHFNFLTVSSQEVHEKVDAIENVEGVKEKFNKIFNNSQYSENVRSLKKEFELYLLEKNIYFYKDELSLTLFTEGNKEEGKTKQVLSNFDEYVFILVKLLLQEERRYNNCWKDLKKFFEENLKLSPKLEKEIFVFSSFDWFNYCILIAVKPKDENDKIDLGKILKNLKKNIILNNELLARTETSIFIGRKILDKVKIPHTNVLLRISSKNLGGSLDFIKNSLVSSDFVETSSSFGIRDVVIRPNNNLTAKELLGIIDDLLEKSSQEGISISDIQIEPFLLWNKEVIQTD